MRNDTLRLATAVLLTFAVTSVPAQTVAKIDFKSVGRAWPLAADMNTYHMTGATLRRTLGNPAQRSQIPTDPRRDPTTGFVGSARNGQTPPGIEPLEVDLRDGLCGCGGHRKRQQHGGGQPQGIVSHGVSTSRADR